MRNPSETAPAPAAPTAQGDWLLPDWPAPPGVQAICSLRGGGHSAGAYASFNLGDHVGDAPAQVAANRAVFARRLGARPVFLSQVHGLDLAALDVDARDGVVADASWTTRAGLACTVMVADCLPVLFTDLRGSRVAAAHAGWRGLAGADGVGILERSCQTLCADGATTADQLLVWLGPCIGPEAFEVGGEVRDAFVAADPQAGAMFQARPAGKWLADLAGLARQRLHKLGVKRIYGNDGSAPWCTVGNPSSFFSHRRDRVSGRFAASIWRRD